MTEDTATVSSEAEKMEEASEPSTSSSEQAKGEDVDTKAKYLIGEGNKHMVMKDVRAAVNSFQEASSLLGKKYGETAEQCADAFYYYGMALLELARMENNVLGNALEGMPEEEDDDECEKEDSNVPSAANLDEEGEESDNEETEEKESEEEVDNLQLAWEMLDLSKIIYKRQKDKETQLKAAQSHLKLGEVSIESENYSQAVEDFLACLKIQKEHLEEHDRLLAETHYQLGLAYQYSSKHDEAISHFTQSIDVIEKRMVVLTEQLEKAAEDSEETQKEMDELKGLLPDIKEKIEDSKEAQKTAEDTDKALKETLGGTTSSFPQENGGTSKSTAAAEKTGDNCVSNITHLVRKKRKTAEEEEGSPVKDAKKCKSEQSPVKDAKCKSEQSPVKDAKCKSEPSPVKDAKCKSEPSPVKDAKCKSEPSPVKDTKCKSEPSPVKDAKCKSEPSPVKDAKCKSEPVENGSGNEDAAEPINEDVKMEEAEDQTPMETATVETTA